MLVSVSCDWIFYKKYWFYACFKGVTFKNAETQGESRLTGPKGKILRSMDMAGLGKMADFKCNF